MARIATATRNRVNTHTHTLYKHECKPCMSRTVEKCEPIINCNKVNISKI